MGKPLQTAKLNTPDELSTYPATGPFWTCDSDGERPVFYAKKGYASEKEAPTMTFGALFDQCVKKKGDKIALRTENMNTLKKGAKAPPALPLAQWKSWTWKEYQRDVRAGAKALIALGVEQHDTCSIFGFNSPEWLISEMSAIYGGCKASGIYPSDTAEQVQYKSHHSNTSIAFCDVETSLNKFVEVVEDLPYLKAIVVWGCKPCDNLTRTDGSTVKVMSFADFLKAGSEVTDAQLDERRSKIKAEHSCALIYTSGTTGFPKAVMISHDCILFEAFSVTPLLGLGVKPEEERVISYLPLSHIAGMLFDVIAPVVIGAMTKGWGSTNFARGYDLKAGTIGDRLKAIQPTVFLGVPRVWEKIADKLKAIGAQTKGIKKKLSTAAKAKGLAYQKGQLIGGDGKTPSWFFILSKLLKVIKGKLGLSKCKVAFSGAAPMTMDTLQYFASLNININEAYGMSECTGATTFSTNACHEWGTVGFEMPGSEVRCFKVAEDGSKTLCPPAKDALQPTEAEQGEICYRGRHIMMGYLANPKLGEEHVAEIKKKNSDAIDSDGWLHSGDKGCISSRGMVRITGRYKELIIGAGGENVAPVPIEDNIKKLCPFVSNIMMVGDKKKFMSCLITLKCKGATGEVAGTNELDAEAAKFGKTIDEGCANADLINAITKALKETGEDGSVTPSNAAKIQKFSILPKDFSVEGGELTATQKLKRSVVADQYQRTIDSIYESKETFVPCIDK